MWSWAGMRGAIRRFLDDQANAAACERAVEGVVECIEQEQLIIGRLRRAAVWRHTWMAVIVVGLLAAHETVGWVPQLWLGGSQDAESGAVYRPDPPPGLVVGLRSWWPLAHGWATEVHPLAGTRPLLSRLAVTAALLVGLAHHLVSRLAARLIMPSTERMSGSRQSLYEHQTIVLWTGANGRRWLAAVVGLGVCVTVRVCVASGFRDVWYLAAQAALAAGALGFLHLLERTFLWETQAKPELASRPLGTPGRRAISRSSAFSWILPLGGFVVGRGVLAGLLVLATVRSRPWATWAYLGVQVAVDVCRVALCLRHFAPADEWDDGQDDDDEDDVAVPTAPSSRSGAVAARTPGRRRGPTAPGPVRLPPPAPAAVKSESAQAMETNAEYDAAHDRIDLGNLALIVLFDIVTP